MMVFKYIVFGLFFAMELFALGAFSYWGFHMNKGWFINTVFGIGTPLLVAIFWGIFIAPKATFAVTIPIRILLQIIVFALATTALFVAGKSKLAIIFGFVVLIEMILMYSIEE
ncbi:YrdB family protein [Psychrobacillus sp. FSL K6-1415]|uniref:YrdB family protein n=1 Tax=Psychrobacillus sp. FSL K6-1415 TaxID=2921544 RepID=UPI0030FBFE70